MHERMNKKEMSGKKGGVACAKQRRPSLSRLHRCFIPMVGQSKVISSFSILDLFSECLVCRASLTPILNPYCDSFVPSSSQKSHQYKLVIARNHRCSSAVAVSAAAKVLRLL